MDTMVLAKGIVEILLWAITRGIPEFSKNRILPPHHHHRLRRLPRPSPASAAAPKHPPPTSPFVPSCHRCRCCPPPPPPAVFSRSRQQLPSPQNLAPNYVAVVAAVAWGMVVADGGALAAADGSGDGGKDNGMK
jgi:hypothetical protein